MWSTKLLVAPAIALVISASAMAHDSNAHDAKMPMQQGQMDCAKMKKHMQMMQRMDHGQMMQRMGHRQMDHMDMNDPAMKRMMANMGKMKQMYQQQCVTSKDKS